MIADRRSPAHRGRQRRRISGPFAHDSRTAALAGGRPGGAALESAPDTWWLSDFRLAAATSWQVVGGKTTRASTSRRTPIGGRVSAGIASSPLVITW
ncbi:MAG: hypothetical protein OXG35_28115 [Acidobacteria bacterium]|nr:hypothetical protein [Acidobacteriota bacterium]